MKKFLLVVVLAVMAVTALSGCVKVVNQSVVEATPQATVRPTMVAGYTLDEFFRAYGGSMNPVFRVVSFDECTNSMNVVYNNMEMTLVNTFLNAHVFLGQANGTQMDFVEMALFSQSFFDAVEGQDLVVMSSTRPYSNQIALVAIPADQMPKRADVATWDKTEMTLSVWAYPFGQPYVVIQDNATGEITVQTNLVTFNEEGHPTVVQPGSVVTGYVHFEPDPNTGFLTLYIGNK
jgi:hypothetical protein